MKTSGAARCMKHGRSGVPFIGGGFAAAGCSQVRSVPSLWRMLLTASSFDAIFQALAAACSDGLRSLDIKGVALVTDNSMVSAFARGKNGHILTRS